MIELNEYEFLETEAKNEVLVDFSGEKELNVI